MSESDQNSPSAGAKPRKYVCWYCDEPIELSQGAAQVGPGWVHYACQVRIGENARNEEPYPEARREMMLDREA